MQLNLQSLEEPHFVSPYHELRTEVNQLILGVDALLLRIQNLERRSVDLLSIATDHSQQLRASQQEDLQVREMTKGGGDKSDDLGDLFFRAALWNAGARPKRPLLPWECEGSILADTLGQPSPSKAMRVEWPSQSLLDQDDLASVVSTAVSASDADLAGAGGLKLVVSKKWLKKSGQCRAWQDERDAARNAALQSWKALIMVSGTGTKLGAIILDAAEEDEELVLESVRDAFSGKATSTLRNRANSLLCYGRWKASLAAEQVVAVFPITEQEAYRYICYIKVRASPWVRLWYLGSQGV